MNQVKRYLGWASVALALFVVGCSEDAARPAAEPVETNGVRAAESVKKESVVTNVGPILVRIDGKDFRKLDVVRNGKVMLVLNMNKARRTKIGKKDFNYLSKYCKDTVSREVGRAAVRKYVEENKLEASSNVIAKVRKDFARRYGIKSKKLKRWHTIDDLKYMLGKNAYRVDEELGARIDYVVATNAMLKARPIVVTDEDVQKRIQSIKDYNARALATNVVVWAKATNVWNEVMANTNQFEELAKKYSEDEYISSGCEWGMFTRDLLSDEEALGKYLPTMKVGDITPPIESDGGLAIVRMDESDDPKNLSFSRIFFRLPMFYDEETADEARQNLVEERTKDEIGETLKAYAAKLKVEYPDGTNVLAGVKGPVVSPKELEECDK